jgi:hypothetical protein
MKAYVKKKAKSILEFKKSVTILLGKTRGLTTIALRKGSGNLSGHFKIFVNSFFLEQWASASCRRSGAGRPRRNNFLLNEILFFILF